MNAARGAWAANREVERRMAGYAPVARIVSVEGSKAIAVLSRMTPAESAPRAEIGSLLKIDTPRSIVLGMVAGMSVPMPVQSASGEDEIRVLELELVGEFPKSANGEQQRFKRGVSCFPSLGDLVVPATREELAHVYDTGRKSSIPIGTLHQDPTVRAPLYIDDLLAKHFAVLGTTGAGKSCAVSLILHRILQGHPNAHIVVLDLHNEYADTFGSRAEFISPETLHIPYWLLSFEEIVDVLTSPGEWRSAESEILAQAIPIAKRRYLAATSAGRSALTRKSQEQMHVGAETPVPYRLSDVLFYLNEQVGKLERTQQSTPYIRLRTRIEQLAADGRYGFMFGSLSVQDTMAETLGRIFRVPPDGRPITILDLSAIPSEILNVVASALFRLTFDLAYWSNGQLPVTLVCEEAHRYAPCRSDAGFEPTRRAMARIAKEGRKYGVSLCIVSQRPSELDATVLSQCSTIFALRLTSSADQDFVRSATSESGVALLDFLPVLGNAEAVILGEGVPLPMRVRFDDVAAENMQPRGRTARFAELWSGAPMDASFLHEAVARWRMQRRNGDEHVEAAVLTAPASAPHVDGGPPPVSRS